MGINEPRDESLKTINNQNKFTLICFDFFSSRHYYSKQPNIFLCFIIMVKKHSEFFPTSACLTYPFNKWGPAIPFGLERKGDVRCF